MSEDISACDWHEAEMSQLRARNAELERQLKEMTDERDEQARLNGMGSEHEAAPQWQPIETAPMDGTDILVTNGKRIYVDFWLERIECWNQSATNESTHWMPLPSVPELRNAKER